MTIDIGAALPNLTLPTDGDGQINLHDFGGKPLVLYFYPKDDTPGCTKEACAFRDLMPDFSALNAVVIGVSRDSSAKHDKFKEKYQLPFPLISDADGVLCESLGVWVEKSMYGRKYMGIDRSTFLVGADGKIARIWRSVKVPGHAEEVLQALRQLG